MNITVPESIIEELRQQFYGDNHYEGFNNITLRVESILEQIGMESMDLELE